VGLNIRLVAALSGIGLIVTTLALGDVNAAVGDIDSTLADVLRREGFTGTIESTLQTRLGRQVDPQLAELGRLLFFDKIGALREDNACAGCHSPTAGMGDTQSIAIGIQNNNIVGQNRRGPRNQRRTPTVVNTAFFPNLMWNGRFSAPSDDPFDNSQGFAFPLPEGVTAFPASDPIIKTLLAAQAHIPPTELVEVAGFTGTAGTIAPEFDQFDDGEGEAVPAPDESGFRNEPIRQALLGRLNASPAYRELFAQRFPEVQFGKLIDFSMFARAIAEFEFTLVLANAPIDRFARGDRTAMSVPEKKGALLFFGPAGCVQCHAVRGRSNEMFSDFEMHVVGVLQIAPLFGVGTGNVVFDGPGDDEDFGLEQVTGDPADRYKFRTSPLRNVALQPAFFHNGAFTRHKASPECVRVLAAIPRRCGRSRHRPQTSTGPDGACGPAARSSARHGGVHARRRLREPGGLRQHRSIGCAGDAAAPVFACTDDVTQQHHAAALSRVPADGSLKCPQIAPRPLRVRGP
jgi:cytochrome c peroxidase